MLPSHQYRTLLTPTDEPAFRGNKTRIRQNSIYIIRYHKILTDLLAVADQVFALGQTCLSKLSWHRPCPSPAMKKPPSPHMVSVAQQSRIILAIAPVTREKPHQPAYCLSPRQSPHLQQQRLRVLSTYSAGLPPPVPAQQARHMEAILPSFVMPIMATSYLSAFIFR